MQELIFTPPDNDSKGRVSVLYFIDFSIYTKTTESFSSEKF